MAPLSKSRLAHLISGDVDRRFIWPALLTAPVLLHLAASVIGIAFSGIVALGSDGPFRFQILMYPITAIVSAAAACAFTAFCTAPKGDWLRVALLLSLTPFVTSFVSVVAFGLAIVPLYYPDVPDAGSISMVLFSSIQPGLSILLNAAIYFFSLRKLRSERMWNRLRAGAELT